MAVSVRALGVLSLAAFGVGLAAATVGAQAPPGRTVWDGVYSDTQATRGKDAYEANCARCHREDLMGGQGPALAGERFMNTYEADSINRLFTTIRTRMPRDAAGTLPEQNYIDIVAYVLKSNTFPPGTADLVPDPAVLRGIRVFPKDGPRPVANFALVKMVGCLTQGPAGWTVTSASDPIATKNPAASVEEELKDAEALPLGTQSVELLTLVVNPAEADKGKKVEAKGLLIRRTQGNRVNLTSLQALAPTCAN